MTNCVEKCEKGFIVCDIMYDPNELLMGTILMCKTIRTLLTKPNIKI